MPLRLRRTSGSSPLPEELPGLSDTAEKDASLLSSWTYGWIYPLVRRGIKTALQMSDLPALSCTDSATKVGPEFHFVYRQLAISDFNHCRPHSQHLALPSISDAPPTLHFLSRFLLRVARFIPSSVTSRTSRATTAVTARQFLVGVLLKPIWLFAAISQSLCIRVIVQYLSQIQEDPPTKTASSRWILLPVVLAMTLASSVMSLTQHAIFASSVRAGLQARASVNSQLYRKMLRLSPASFSSFASGGNIANLLVTDVQRIVDSFQYFHFCWFGFIEIAVIAAILSIDLGLSALIGITVVLVLCPMQLLFASLAARSRRRVTAAADLRVQQMHDILSAIRLVKYSSWESHFRTVIARLRREEIRHLRASAVVRVTNAAIFYVAPVFVSFVTFVSYTFLFRKRLSPTIAFSTVAFYAILARTLVLLPLGWLANSEASVSARRIDRFLDLPELSDVSISVRLDVATWAQSNNHHADNVGLNKEIPQSRQSSEETAAIQISVNDVSFTYASAKTADEDEDVIPVLSDVNLTASKGDLVCVIGAVGSGKSTLLNGLIGEVRQLKGSVAVNGRIAYCSQQPWIVNGTLRHNIMLFAKNDNVSKGDDEFSSHKQEEWFNKVITACCLREDLDVLPAREKTEIGERGINLSGGQKARVALARAVFACADIYLLDDPLAAVDAAVSKQLTDNVLGPNGILRQKIRIVATNQAALLPLSNYIVMLSGGTVANMGTPTELIAQGVVFQGLEKDSNDNVKQDRSSEGALNRLKEGGELNENGQGPLVEDVEKGIPLNNGSESGEHIKESLGQNISYENSEGVEDENGASGKLVIEEDRKYGHVSWSVFWAYVTAGGGVWVVLFIFLTFLASQAMRTAAEVWIGRWTTGVDESISTSSAQFTVENWKYLKVYIIFAGSMLGSKLLSAAFFALFCILASRCLHDRLVDRVLYAKTSFFDTNPLGRILNRFGKDVDQVDMLLPIAMQDVLIIGTMVLGALVTICWIFPWLLITVVVSSTIFYIYQSQYKKSSRELKRLDAIAYSPIYTLFVQTLGGNSTIRAFGFQGEFSTAFDTLVDQHHATFHVFQMVGRWLGVRLDYVATVVVGCTAFAIVAAGDSLSVGLAGVAITQSLLLTGVFQYGVRQLVETENLFTSVERMVTMATETPLEAAHYVAKTSHTETWPSDGVVSFHNVVLKYRPELPPALNRITFSTRPRERIGIVGRTGSGKSSILVALFRMVELTDGEIYIDGIDISTLGLNELRSRISIVPQDANLFNGTIRSNLDPTGTCTDAQLWDALDRVYMRNVVEAMGRDGTVDETGAGLDAVVRENGANLSVGERQLLCLARVILSGVKIVVLDEASASLDNATDVLIQQTVRQQLRNKTIITIAHRLATIADYDRILVVDAGRVVEFDSPQVLERSGGHFARLVSNIKSCSE